MRVRPEPLDRWHGVVESADPAMLDSLLADACVFRSPAVHRPQEGRTLARAYLTAALVVLGPTLRYRHEWWDESSAVLEFEAELGTLVVHGVDMLRWDEAGLLTEFTVFVRPFKALTQLMTLMVPELDAATLDAATLETAALETRAPEAGTGE